MPRLILYIPFPRHVVGPNQGDLRTNAIDLVNEAAVPCQINGLNITAIIAVFAGEEAANPLLADDILVLHAHGGAADTGLTDNMGNDTTMATAIGNLGVMHADRASMAFMIVCYSASVGHIGPVWKAANVDMPTYGAPGIVQGAIAQVTRQGTIRHAMFFIGDPRMEEIEG